MDNTISRTCGSVRSSLAAPAQPATVVSEAAVTTHLRPTGRGDDREEVAATASVNGGRRVRLNDRPNVSELLQTPSNPIEPKTLTGSSQKARSRLPHEDLGHTNSMTAGVETGTNSFVSSERNRINPSSRLVEAGVIARCAAGMPGRGCWKKRTSFCNETNRGCNIAPPCRRADFQPVMRDERTGKTFVGGNRK
jgi:hypothetical protein